MSGPLTTQIAMAARAAAKAKADELGVTVRDLFVLVHGDAADEAAAVVFDAESSLEDVLLNIMRAFEVAIVQAANARGDLSEN
jgi:hypothetical protein